MEEFVEIIGKEAGPTSVILAGVHGDERGGIEALQKLLPTLKIEKGRVFLGFGNPRAIEQNKRFTETNLNRMFKPDSMLSDEEKMSYEYSRAQFIKKYLDQADALLDLHASYVPDGKPFIICEPIARDIVDFLPVQTVVFCFDQIQPGGTDYYMNKCGGVGVCVECGYLDDASSVQVASESILSFLGAMGHTKSTNRPLTRSYFSIYEMYMTKTDSFTLDKSFVDFEKILEGQLIGVDGDKEVRAQKESIVLFARDCKKVGEEAFLLGEQKNSLAY